ncbi:MAG: flavodoxin family protein [Bacillota bacterium]|nr:flavodoxin family protein [Bacillota bacterium]
MKFLILKGSPRAEGNTGSLVKEFTDRLEQLSAVEELSREEFDLYNMDIKPCRACRMCQRDRQKPDCVINDDMQILFSKILEADVIVLATPIYSWYASPPMKALLDRCVYALNKYYGSPAEDKREDGCEGSRDSGPSIWRGKQLALITTCGYEPSKGADLLDEGLRRYCKHSGLIYRGMLAERDPGYDKEFMDCDKAMRARDFCDILVQQRGNKE